MTWTAIVLAFISEAVLLLYSSSLIKRPELFFLKNFLFLFGVMFSFMTALFPLVISANPDNLGALNPLAIAWVIVNVLLLMGFMLFYVVYLFNNSAKFIQYIVKKGGR